MIKTEYELFDHTGKKIATFISSPSVTLIKDTLSRKKKQSGKYFVFKKTYVKSKSLTFKSESKSKRKGK